MYFVGIDPHSVVGGISVVVWGTSVDRANRMSVDHLGILLVVPQDRRR